MTRILISILLSISLLMITDYLYNNNKSSKIYNTKNYSLTYEELNARYDQETFLFPYHIYYLNGNLSSKAFRIYSHFLLFVFSVALISLAIYSISFFVSILFTIALAISPVYLIQLNWIGFPEHLTFFLLGILILTLYFRDRLPAVVLHSILILLFLLGLWTHFYQFIIATFLILLVDAKFRKEYPIFLYGNFILSILIAKILSNQIFLYYGIEQNYDRAVFAFGRSIQEWYNVHKVPLPLTFWNLFHGLVFLILYLVLVRRDKILIFMILIGCLVTFFTYDTTRVFSNLFFPGFFYYLILKLESEDSNRLQLYGLLLVLGLLLAIFTEPFYVWGSRIIYLN